MSVSVFSEETKAIYEWKFIPYAILLKEEKRRELENELSRAVAGMREFGSSESSIESYTKFLKKDIEEDMKDERVNFQILNNYEIISNFPQLEGLKQPYVTPYGLTYPTVALYEYKLIVIGANTVKRSILDCRAPDKENKVSGLNCRYKDIIAHFSTNPRENFSIVGNIKLNIAVGMAKAWTSRKTISEIKINKWIPRTLSKLSYKDGLYSLHYTDYDCHGSIEVLPVEIDHVVHIKLLSNPELWCP